MSSIRARFLAVMGIVSVLVLALTFRAVAWSWGFVLVYASLGFVLRVVARARHTASMMAYPLLPGVSAVILARFFYGQVTSWLGAAHVGAVLVLSLLTGVWLANRLPFPDAGPRKAVGANNSL